MSIPTKCNVCGHQSTGGAILITNAKDAIIRNVSESCSQIGCNGRAIYQSGKYDIDGQGNITSFVADAVSVLRSPEMTRAKVQKFKEIAESVDAGEMDAQVAYVEVSQLDDSLASLWGWTNENAGTLGVLLAILSFFVAHYYFRKSSDSSVEDRQVAERNARALEKIGEELEKRGLSGAELGGSPLPK